jgi:anionic cell wall polymer biosynthesis LytR-Cps2A-Psr (LCP) family protein
LEIKDYDKYKVTLNRNRNSKAIRILLVVFCILIVGASVSAYIVYGIMTNNDASSLFLDPRKPDTIVANPNDHINSLVPQNVASKTIKYNGKTYKRNEHIVNLLFLGIDYTEERAEMNLGYRSDMVLVCAVDTISKKATLISIPRDTYTTMYKIDSKSGYIKDTTNNKINAAFAFGGGPKHYGYENSMACVEMFLERRCNLDNPLDFTLNIPVYLYAGIDIDGIAPVASAVGGVEVTLEVSIPGVGSKGEIVSLKGDKAEEYIRNRHDSGGDLNRAGRQQTFMMALAKKIKNMGAFNIILSLYDDLQKYVNTTLSTNQMLDFAKILSKTDIDAIEKLTIPGKPGSKSGTSYFFHDEEKTLQMLLDIYYTEAS